MTGMDAEIKKLENAAVKEDWAYVDKALPYLARSRKVMNWALSKGLNSQNVNKRDLAASILEKAKISKSEIYKVQEPLGEALKRDKNNYAGFRAACALAAHNVEQYKPEVVSILKRFSKDDDVKEIAKSYLKKLKAY